MSSRALQVIGRSEPLLIKDVKRHERFINESIKGARILVVGAAGTIGLATTLELFERDPRALHVVDLSENNLVELVRQIRSSRGYGSGDFKTFALDITSPEFDAMCEHHGPYDYVFNLAALKHVRSESDPFTLMRMINVNIFGAVRVAKIAQRVGAKKYFCVSTDKATNPVNMMGASKRVMELFIGRESSDVAISMARFANVAFSDGSLLHGFSQRLKARQPLSAPRDVERYFITSQESGNLCLLSGVLGENKDIFFPKLSEKLVLTKFSDIALRFIQQNGYEPYLCESEDEARREAENIISAGKWPCLFFDSDTTGEKGFEEFFTDSEQVDTLSYRDLGVIKSALDFNSMDLDRFQNEIESMVSSGGWSKDSLVDLFQSVLPNFRHDEKGRYLDQKM